MDDRRNASHALAPVVVAGPLGAGKDYVASRFLEALHRARRPAEFFALGDHYYDIVAARHNLSFEEIRSRKPEFRDELQKVGADPRAQGSAIEIAVEKLAMLREQGVSAIVTVRKQREIDALHLVGARTVGVDAPLADRLARVADRDGCAPTPEQSNHSVEEDARTLRVGVLVPNDRDAGELRVELFGNKLFMRNNRFGFGLELGIRRPSMRAIA